MTYASILHENMIIYMVNLRQNKIIEIYSLH